MPHIEHTKGWPSVTKIISVLDKPGLVYWYGKHGTEKCSQLKREAEEFGTEFHAVIEGWFKGENVFFKDPKAYKLAMEVINKWWAVKPREIISLEKEVEHKGLKYHGCFDALIKTDDRLFLVDWKSSARFYDTMALQLAGYRMALESMGEEVPDDGIVVRADKESGKIEEKVFKDLKNYEKEFKALRLLWDFVNHKGRWSKCTNS
jgi:hypothetical protein